MIYHMIYTARGWKTAKDDIMPRQHRADFSFVSSQCQTVRSRAPRKLTNVIDRRLTLGTQIGFASFHSTRSTVDLEFRTAVVPLKSKGHFTRSMEFQSSVGLLTWQYDSALSNTARLLNPQGNWLARFESSALSWSKVGKLEIAGWVNWGPGLLDEVISGMAIVPTNMKMTSAAASA